MTDRPAGPEHEIAELQARLRQQHEQLRAMDAGQPGYVDAARAVLQRTFELIDLEERLPLLLDSPRRELSERVIRWTGRAGGAVLVLCAVAAALGMVSRWWLPLPLVLLPVAVWLMVLPVCPVGDRHLIQRTGAVLIAAAVLLTPLVMAGALSAWAGLVVVAAAGAGVVCLIRVTPRAGGTR
jgi:hypothetical protein